MLDGCSLIRSWEAKRAYGEYQAAVASGDLVRTRRALTALVKADEDVAEYWTELGRVQLQLGDYNRAYDAFSHAHELDRTNVQILSIMTRLALVSSQVDLATENSKMLSLLSPDDPAVNLVDSYAALQSGNLDKSDALADKVLAAIPTDPIAKILKAHVLVARGRVDDAIRLLEDQHRSVPNERNAIRGLISLYRSRDDWRNLARIQLDLHKLDPRDRDIADDTVEALLRAGNVSAARAVSGPLLSASAKTQTVDAALDAWARFAPRGTMLPGAMVLASSASGEKRVAFANYFNRMGKPAAAMALLDRPILPVQAANVRWNAVFAQALAFERRRDEAKRLFDQVLEVEPDQVEALRGRAALEAQIGMAKQAVVDAQRLVSLAPASGENRILLAQSYRAAGSERDVQRTLWQAFQDLPTDERVFAALRGVLMAAGDSDGARRLNGELAAQRAARLTKELI